MKKTNISLLQFSLAFAGLTLVGAVSATAAPISVTDPNAFYGETINGAPSIIADQSASATFQTSDQQPSTTIQYISFTGAPTAHGIATINIFDAPSDVANNNFPNFPSIRTSPAVTIYYRTTSTAGLTSTQLLDPSFYTALNSGTAFNLSYPGTAADLDSGGAQVQYDTLSGLLIPQGTTSVLFGFSLPQESASIIGSHDGVDFVHGIALTEIQAIESTPEPSTVALSFVGLGALLFGAWRKRRTLA